MNASTMVNTPGGYYALAYWLGCNLIILFSPKKLKMLPRIGVQVLFLSLLMFIMTISDNKSDYMFVPLMLLYMFMIYVDIYINCMYDAKTVLHFAVRAFILGEFAASFEWQIYYYVIENQFLPKNWITDLLFLVIAYGLIFAIFYQFEKK